MRSQLFRTSPIKISLAFYSAQNRRFAYSPEMITSLRFSILEVTLSTSSKTAIPSTLSQHCWVCEQHDEPEKKGFRREVVRYAIQNLRVTQMQIFAEFIAQASHFFPFVKIFCWTTVLVATFFVLGTIFMVVALI